MPSLALKAAFALFVAMLTFCPDSYGGEKVIKIGVMADMSGFAADAGGPGAVLAAKLAVEDFGGMLGAKTVEVIAADMQNKPDVAASIARKWFDEEGVDVITDLPVSPVALAVQAIARERKKLLVITAAATTELTGKSCSPWTVHLADDTAALGKSTASAILAQGGRTWFIITADFAFGTAMAAQVKATVEKGGGTVLGEVKHPLATNDFSSFVLAAQASKAQVVALANSANDTVNAIKTAREFGLVQGGQRLASTLLFISDVHALGLDVAKGLSVVTGFYWDENDATRAFSKRFLAKFGKMPTKEQANTYAGVKAYLKTVEGAGSDQPDAVIKKFKSQPLDYFGRPVQVRADGRALYDLTLYEVKTPEASKSPWDYYARVATVSSADAFVPLSQGGCPFVSDASAK